MTRPDTAHDSFIRISARKIGLRAGPIRWMLLTPLLAVLALAALMGSTIWYLTETEKTQRRDALIRDIDSAQRAVREKLTANESLLANASARILAQTSAPSLEQELKKIGEELFIKNPEILYVGWVDQSGTLRAIESASLTKSDAFGRINAPIARASSKKAFDAAMSSRLVRYSAPMPVRQGDQWVDVYVPTLKDARPHGALIATYSLQSLLINDIPKDISYRVVFALSNPDGEILARTRGVPEFPGRKPVEINLEPIGNDLKLRAYDDQPDSSFYNDIMGTAIVGLISLAVVSQIVIWRNTRRRLTAEGELAEEIAFRRAMENSLSTGMRVIGLDGVITYVNPAFCRMVGFDYVELVGKGPPYPYWPSEAVALHQKNLDQMLRGDSPPSSLPIHIMRKDGSRIVVRMYTSPLIDQNGKQTGWMTSVTDITEQTKIRQELAQAQERFITVLQSLDSAVSVAAPESTDELLFANQSYKKWFGTSLLYGHRFFMTSSGTSWSEVRDVYNPKVERWFEVRVRNIQWVDGRIVELVVATDVTEELLAEQAQREQHARLQQTSRLVTMGEMASSLAHELNQPLTAITNYASGAVARLKSAPRQEPPPIDDLIELLEKTAKQAERAGQVIRRIRGFVKRSDPIRKATDVASIVSEAIGLAEIDAREHSKHIEVQIDPRMPILHVDPILIEQVLLNLIKNGIESMRDSPQDTLLVEAKFADQQALFSITDRGPGIPKAIRERLFDSFYTTKADGMGMGLNICRSIIESHSGRLWFEDNPQGGSVFRFTLPVLAPAEAPQRQPNAEKLLT